jgi:hypothetical protein
VRHTLFLDLFDCDFVASSNVLSFSYYAKLTLAQVLTKSIVVTHVCGAGYLLDLTLPKLLFLQIIEVNYETWSLNAR